METKIKTKATRLSEVHPYLLYEWEWKPENGGEPYIKRDENGEKVISPEYRRRVKK